MYNYIVDLAETKKNIEICTIQQNKEEEEINFDADVVEDIAKELHVQDEKWEENDNYKSMEEYEMNTNNEHKADEDGLAKHKYTR